MKKLNDVITIGNLFGNLFGTGAYANFQWCTDLLNAIGGEELIANNGCFVFDMEYIYNHSGDLLASKFVLNNLETNGKWGNTGNDKLWKLINYRLKNKWDRLWNLTKAEYNPIENYSMVEEETLPTKTTEQQHFEDYEVTTSQNTDKDIHQEENADVDRSEDVYGFNSNTSVPLGTSNESKDKTKNYVDTNESGLAENNFITESHSKDGEDNKEVTTESYDVARELTRSGNIGVTTSQQMIQSEIELWQWNFIQDVVYKDLDDILTIEMYESEI